MALLLGLAPAPSLRRAADAGVTFNWVVEAISSPDVITLLIVERALEGSASAPLLLSADPARLPVRQTRVAFIWKHQSFIVHEYEAPRAGLCVLHCQTQTGKGRAASSRTLMGDGPESADEQAAPLEMPPFIEAGDEIAALVARVF